jgi:deoxyribodipyrimidine photolyase-related protein
MKSFEKRHPKLDINYINNEKNKTLEKLLKTIKENGIKEIKLTEILDNKLKKTPIKLAKSNNTKRSISESPGFLTDRQWIRKYFSNNNYKITSFYIAQRKRLGVLEENGKPIGGKWSFDVENRDKLPKDFPIPEPSNLLKVLYYQ